MLEFNARAEAPKHCVFILHVFLKYFLHYKILYKSVFQRIISNLASVQSRESESDCNSENDTE